MKKVFIILLAAALIIGSLASNITTASLSVAAEASGYDSYQVVMAGDTVVDVTFPVEETDALQKKSFIGLTLKEFKAELELVSSNKKNRIRVVSLSEVTLDSEYEEMLKSEKIAYLNLLMGAYASNLEIAEVSLDSLLSLDTSEYTEEELSAHNDAILTLEAEIETLIADLSELEELFTTLECNIIMEQMQERAKIQENVLHQYAIDIQFEKAYYYYAKKAGVTAANMYRFMCQVNNLNAKLEELQVELDELLLVDTSAYTEEELIAYNEEVAGLEAEILELEISIVEKDDALCNAEMKVLQVQEKVQRRVADTTAKMEQLKAQKQQVEAKKAQTKAAKAQAIANKEARKGSNSNK